MKFCLLESMAMTMPMAMAMAMPIAMAMPSGRRTETLIVAALIVASAIKSLSSLTLSTPMAMPLPPASM